MPWLGEGGVLCGLRTRSSRKMETRSSIAKLDFSSVQVFLAPHPFNLADALLDEAVACSAARLEAVFQNYKFRSSLVATSGWRSALGSCTILKFHD